MRHCPCCESPVADTDRTCPVCLGRLDDAPVYVQVGAAGATHGTNGTASSVVGVISRPAPPVPPVVPTPPMPPTPPSQVTQVPPFTLLNPTAAPAPTLAPAPVPARVRSRTRRRAARVSLRHTLVAYCAVVIAGVLGAVYLSGALAPSTAARTAVRIGGTGLVADLPAGWAPVQDSGLAELRDGFLVGADGVRPDGPVMVKGKTRLAVLDVPNPAEMTVVPEFPAQFGSVTVVSQAPWATPLGPARELATTGSDHGNAVESRATFVIHDTHLVLVAVYAPRHLSASDLAAFDAVRASLRPIAAAGAPVRAGDDLS